MGMLGRSEYSVLGYYIYLQSYSFRDRRAHANFFLSISIPGRDPRALTNPDDSRNLSARSGQGCIWAMDFGARLIGSDPKKA